MNRIQLEMEEHSYEMTEELKTLRTNIQFSGSDKKVILVTSCIQSEGKSSTSWNLAQTFAELKKKVLLIDADLRRSVFLNRVAGEEKPEKGLSHFLSGQASLSDVIYGTNVRGLHVIAAGPVPPNPTELLSTHVFEKMIEALRDIYDYIIIDSAPLGMVIDAAIIAKQSDGAILVIESEKIKYRFAQDVKEKLVNTGCPLLGAVLTKVKRSNHGKYYGKYYKQYYKKDEA